MTLFEDEQEPPVIVKVVLPPLSMPESNLSEVFTVSKREAS